MLVEFKKNVIWYDLAYVAGQREDITDQNLLERWIRAGVCVPVKEQPKKEIEENGDSDGLKKGNSGKSKPGKH